MYKDNILTISDWTKGMGDSAYTGFSNIQNCEVFETIGVAKIGNRTSAKYPSVTFTGLPVAYVEDAYGNNYTLTSNGVCWKNGTAIQSGLGNAWDLAIYNDYLIISHSTVISCYGPLNNAPEWFANRATGLNGVYYAKLLPYKNGYLYVANGNKLGVIDSFSGGTPSVAPTVNLNDDIIIMPPGEAITTMATLGENIILGTQSLNGAWASATNGNIANLYLFDGFGIQGKANSLIASLAESGITSMLSFGNKLYVMAGTRGNLYVSNTADCQKIKRLPWNQSKTFGTTTMVYPNAMAINMQGNLLVGTSSLADAFPNVVSKHGVYEVSLTENYPTIFKQIISTGNIGQTQVLKIGCLYSNNGITTIGWQDGASTYGLDVTTYLLYLTGTPTVESQLFYVGSRLNRKIFQNLEFLLGKPLVLGQSITISARKNLTDSYTTIGTYSYTDLGTVISHNTKALLDDVEVLQIKIQLITTNTSNMELLKITIW